MKPNRNSVLITGGGSGIGKALAEIFTRNGNNVLLVGRNESALQQLAHSLPNCSYRICDLRKQEQVDDLTHFVESEFATLNLLINNAGIQLQYPDAEDFGDISAIASEIHINLTAPAQLTSRLLPILSSKKNAGVIMVTSALAVSPKQIAPYYCASKAGLHSLCQSLEWRLEGTGIHLMELIPPLTDTRMTEGRNQKTISPDRLADLFWPGFLKDQRVIAPAEAGKVLTLARWLPGLARKITRHSK